MHLEDGRVLIGTAKEKDQAAQEYEKALRDGKQASLVEWVADDGIFKSIIIQFADQILGGPVFTISIGSIPANQRVTTKLVVSHRTTHPPSGRI